MQLSHLLTVFSVFAASIAAAPIALDSREADDKDILFQGTFDALAYARDTRPSTAEAATTYAFNGCYQSVQVIPISQSFRLTYSSLEDLVNQCAARQDTRRTFVNNTGRFLVATTGRLPSGVNCWTSVTFSGERGACAEATGKRGFDFAVYGTPKRERRRWWEGEAVAGFWARRLFG